MSEFSCDTCMTVTNGLTQVYRTQPGAKVEKRVRCYKCAEAVKQMREPIELRPGHLSMARVTKFPNSWVSNGHWLMSGSRVPKAWKHLATEATAKAWCKSLGGLVEGRQDCFDTVTSHLRGVTLERFVIQPRETRLTGDWREDDRLAVAYARPGDTTSGGKVWLALDYARMFKLHWVYVNTSRKDFNRDPVCDDPDMTVVVSPCRID